MSTIEIENIGPLTKLEIPLPETGGVVVLRGRNGAGKSQALAAIDKLTADKGRVVVNDAADKGTVSGLGAVLTVAKATRRKGTLEVESLEGRLSLDKLVEPGIIDPERADATRIKAIIALADVKPDPEKIVPAGMIQHVQPGTLKINDVLSLAQGVKADLEAVAREKEALAEKHHIEAEAAKQVAAGVEIVEIDEAGLRSVIRENERGLDRIAERKKMQDTRLAEWQCKQAELAELRKSAETKTVDDYAAEYVAAVKADKASIAQIDAAEARVKKLAEELNEANRAVRVAVEAGMSAKNAVVKAQSELENAKARAEYVAKLEAASAPEPAEDFSTSVAECEQQIAAARVQLEKVPLIRQAIEAQQRQESAIAQYEAAASVACNIRDAARSIDKSLSAIIGELGIPLRVEGNRLVTATKRGASTPFGELSAGERWRIALDLAVSVAGTRTLFTIPQEAWEGLDPVNREAIATQAQEQGVTIITAECSEDEEVTVA